MTDQVVADVPIDNSELEKNEEKLQERPVEATKETKKGREGRLRKKDEKKRTDQALKGLNDVNITADKTGVVCKKYTEVIDENKKLQMMLKQYDKKILVLQREKDQLQNERSKALLTRQRLENLCRELQKQNKAIKEETLLKIREQEQSRRKLSEQFHANLAQVKTLMNANIDKTTKIFEGHKTMTETFETVHDKVQLTENQILTAYRKMKTALEEVHSEKDELQKKNERYLFKIAECQAQIKEMQETEAALKSQINMYSEKYDEFQKALQRSDKISKKFKEEISLMSKKNMLLKEEATLWKKRFQSNQGTVHDPAGDKHALEQEALVASLNKKVSLLQGLCKMFQSERANLIAQLKEKEGKGESLTDKAAKSDIEVKDSVIENTDDLSKVSATLEERIEPECLENADAVEKEATEESCSKEESNTDLNTESEDKNIKPDEPFVELTDTNNTEKCGENLTQEETSNSCIPCTEDSTVNCVETKNIELDHISNNSNTDESKKLDEKEEHCQEEENFVQGETETILEQLDEAIESVQHENTDNETINELLQANGDAFVNLISNIKNDIGESVNKDLEILSNAIEIDTVNECSSPEKSSERSTTEDTGTGTDKDVTNKNLNIESTKQQTEETNQCPSQPTTPGSNTKSGSKNGKKKKK